jgi:hypothetical protein
MSSRRHRSTAPARGAIARQWRGLFACGALLSLAACGGGGSSGGGESANSQTSDATPPTAGSVTISWTAPTSNTNGTPISSLSGYHIFYGTSASALTQSIEVSGAATLSYEISDLTAGRWYFAVAADASDGTQSAPSEVASMTI